MQRFQLELIGITYNQIESGVYALVLQQIGTTRRIPIIIGFPEAQAIECKLQEIKTPRPLTHDIMVETMNSFGIHLNYVMIKRLPNGVFAADLYVSDGMRDFIIDSRSSDAVALAIRTGSPIYTTEDVIREAGFDPEEVKRSKTTSQEKLQQQRTIQKKSSFENMTLEQLSQAMLKAAEAENYEEAAKIKSIIDSRQTDEEQKP